MAAVLSYAMVMLVIILHYNQISYICVCVWARGYVSHEYHYGSSV